MHPSARYGYQSTGRYEGIAPRMGSVFTPDIYFAKAED